MRHQQWTEVLDYLNGIAEHMGSTIIDKRCGKAWDVGQAICAEAYGPDWMNDDELNAANELDDTEPPEQHYYDCAKRMASGYIPDWVEI